ncbi:MAG: anthranilate phosphoribosyltransferase [Hyphomicrobiaceae bacterium]|nr:MAG: anthranilate phosphoribosyltransferase [Hyphomicrobiaceae bacterium]
MTDLKPFIQKIATRAALSEEEAAAAFEILMSGGATPSQIGAFLMGLRVRGETIDELVGAARVMRAKVTPVVAPPAAIDIVGTGGDASGTYNISTCATFVVAGAGVPIAKHGNRALSSRSGAADVLSELGVRIDLPPEAISRSILEAGVGFMFAPNHHSAMKYVGPTRVEIGTRTIFNLLGPVCNPAGVKRLLLGVFAQSWVEPIANVMSRLGCERVWVVHGSDGLDEITTTGPTYAAEALGGIVRSFEIKPEDAGLKRARPEDLKGGSAADNANAIREVLAGKRGPFRDVVLLNSAAALLLAGKASDLKGGAELAAASIDRGQAAAVLDRLLAVTRG